jgi:hypothetical protein
MSEFIEEGKKLTANEIYEKYIKFSIFIHPDAKPYIMLALLKCWSEARLEGYEAGKKIERIRHSNWLNSNLGEILKKLQNNEEILIP